MSENLGVGLHKFHCIIILYLGFKKKLFSNFYLDLMV